MLEFLELCDENLAFAVDPVRLDRAARECKGARAIAGGDAVLRKASIAHANWRRGGPVTVAIAPGTLLDLPSDVTDTILDFLGQVSYSTSAPAA